MDSSVHLILASLEIQERMRLATQEAVARESKPVARRTAPRARWRPFHGRSTAAAPPPKPAA